VNKFDSAQSHIPLESVGACVCFIGAIVAVTVGSLLTTAWLLNAQLHPWLRSIGLILLIIALPILILGGHFLDLSENREKDERETCAWFAFGKGRRAFLDRDWNFGIPRQSLP
jgi:hypothetical protein